MRLLDLFAGIGGFSHGLKMAGMELVGYCEIDKHAHKAFQILHDPEERLWSAYDVRTIDPVRLPDFDCMCFGWPCQDNSIGGKRAGQREGTRSGLLYEATRILRAKKPSYFVAENVLGLLSVNDGRDFYSTIREFTDVGYDVQWGVLNSSAYVPQNRERIFFVGHLRGQPRPEVFPIGQASEETATGDQERILIRWQNKEAGAVLDNIAPTLRSSGGSDIRKRPCVLQLGRGFNKGGTHDIAPTITKNSWEHNNHLYDGYTIRKLTPLECFRLQSFPDEWYYKLKEHGISDSQLYKMAGNAVTSRVAYEIGIRIMNLPKAFARQQYLAKAAADPKKGT